MPAFSGVRPPHIHLAVVLPNDEELVTRYVVPRARDVGLDEDRSHTAAPGPRQPRTARAV